MLEHLGGPANGRAATHLKVSFLAIGLFAGGLLVSGHAPAGASPAVVDSANVSLLGFLPIPEADPWVADVWGYADEGGEYALVCQGNALRVVDVSDPANPVTASIVAARGRDLKDCKTWGTHAYCVLEDGGIQVVDLANPHAAQDRGVIGHPLGYHNCFIDERGLLYACGLSAPIGMEIYDLTADPEDPPRLSSWDTRYIHDINVRDGLLLACYISDGFYSLIDVSDPARPVQLATFTHDEPLDPHSGWITQNLDYAYTCDESISGHLIVWDIRNRSDIRIVDEYQSGDETTIHNVHIEGNLAYISYYGEGMRVLSIADPAHPVEVGHWKETNVSDWGVYPHTPSGNVYFGDMYDPGMGLYVARYNGPAAGVPEPSVSAGAAARIWPNPTRGATTIRIPAGTQAGKAAILDLSGRLLRSWGPSASGPRGPRDLLWDGADASGRPLPAGVYFLRLDGREGGRIVRIP